MPGVYILYFFLGFVVMSQIGGRILDRRGADPPSCSGARSARSGSTCSPGKLTDLSLSAQMAVHHDRRRRGSGLMLEAGQHRCRQPSAEHELQRGHRNHPDRAELRRQPRTRRPRRDPHRSEQDQRHATHSPKPGCRGPQAAQDRGIVRRPPWPPGPAPGTPRPRAQRPGSRRAQSTQTVFYIMAGVMAATFVVAFMRLPRGRVALPDEREEVATTRAPAEAGV